MLLPAQLPEGLLYLHPTQGLNRETSMSTKSKALLSNPYGYYDADRREYVITRPDTPTPWFNFIGEGRYGGIVSNAAGGLTFDRDPKNRRVSRYRYNALPADQPGRYIYIRDMESGKYWSPTAQPTPAVKLSAYECRHGAGYTKIASNYNGITASLLYFVPPAPADETCRASCGHSRSRTRARSHASCARFPISSSVSAMRSGIN